MGTRRSFEPEPPAAADVDVEALIGRFGTNANSLFVRYPAAWRFFVGSSSEGAVPYLLVGRTVIAWADPLCSDAERADLLGEFLTAMRGLRRRVVFLAVGKLVARAAMDLRCSVINVGAEPTFDLSTWRVPAGDPGKHLRWALNHARRAGVIVEDFRPGARSSAPVEAE
ncbi:MAG TPA: phosphatidylglycerol lysyltransferase domain-containing protein, partial [Actinomycetota bacterium]